MQILYFFMGIAMKFVHSEKGVRYAAIIFALIMVPIYFLVLPKPDVLMIFVRALILCIAVYIWGLILLKYDDTVIAWLVALVVGAFLIGRFL